MSEEIQNTFVVELPERLYGGETSTWLIFRTTTGRSSAAGLTDRPVGDTCVTKLGEDR
jgi:hypothetical protein